MARRNRPPQSFTPKGKGPMKIFSTTLLMASAFLLLGSPLPAQVLPGEEGGFQAAIKQLGGTIRREAMRPGRPFVAVHLRGPQVTDAALQLLASQPDLETLVLVDTKISDAGLERLANISQLQTLDLVSRDT